MAHIRLLFKKFSSGLSIFSSSHCLVPLDTELTRIIAKLLRALFQLSTSSLEKTDHSNLTPAMDVRSKLSSTM